MAKPVVWFSVLVVIFGAIAAYQLQHYNAIGASVLPSTQVYPIRINSQTIYVRVADTPQTQEQGLSGTPSLPGNQGLLFVFPADGKYPFWMKDMNYSIDILWLADDGSVVYIAPNVTPQSYPRTYVSTEPARYVLEVNAGFASSHGIKIGTTSSL